MRIYKAKFQWSILIVTYIHIYIYKDPMNCLNTITRSLFMQVRLTIAAIRRYFRNYQSIIFSFFTSIQRVLFLHTSLPTIQMLIG